jgi:hypothetical protein
MGTDAHACPVCGQPVDTVVKRHKTLGAWVPVWVAGPCRDPGCAAYAEEGVEAAGAEKKARRAATGAPRGERTPERSPGP